MPQSTSAAIQQAADALYDAHENGQPTEPITGFLEDMDIEGAYAVQELNTSRWLAGGRRLVGRKIGLTAKAVQAQLGVDQPDYGMLFADMSIDEGAEIRKGSLLQPRVEAEIAFVLGSDLPEADTTTAEMLQAIEFALPAIEVVDSRVADWKIGIVDTVADNASSGVYVLGSKPVAMGDFDSLSCGMVMESGGEPISTGVGRACLGSPVSAAAWLARTMARIGRPLSAGDVILSGALGPMVGVNWGDVVEARISGLGTVTAVFGS